MSKSKPAPTPWPPRAARRALLLTLATGLCLAACKPRVDAPPPADRVKRVLFIGNSYVYYNNLPKVLETLAASASPPEQLETKVVTVGGARLKTHWDTGDAVEALREGGWDFVVLQEQSTLGVLLVDGQQVINDPERLLFPYARRFHEEARQQGAKTVLALTWSRRSAPEAQARLDHAFFTLGRELGATVTPLGPAWQAALEQHPDLTLYAEDGSHPSPAGTYLAACTLYATLFGRSPEGLVPTVRGAQIPNGQPSGGETTLVSLTEAQALALQQAAWKTAGMLRARGGTLDLPAPPPHPLPSLPSGASVRWEALPGAWEGELRLYPEEWRQSPARLRLELTQAGGEYTGSLRITFTDGGTRGPYEVRATRSPEGTLRFTTPFDGSLPGEARHEAVMTSDGRLVGTVAWEDPQELDRAFGSWRLDAVR